MKRKPNERWIACIRLVLLIAILLISCMADEDEDNVPSYSSTSAPTKSASGPMKIAFLVTGQLARLELVSKIENIFIANAAAGHIVHVFFLLDHNITEVKQTFWRYDYDNTPYRRMNRQDLKNFVDQRVEAAGFNSQTQIFTRTRFEYPAQTNFSVRPNDYPGGIPVTDKIGPTDIDAPMVPVEPALVRWNNNMRWLSGLRECTKWMMKAEYEQKWFYDLVVRLRDDTYAFGPWVLTRERYKGVFVSTKLGVHFGVNDHNFVVDRYWADPLFRGITEDYYFNETLDLYTWGNPERRIFKVATMNVIPLVNTTLCEQPLVPLRGMLNKTHWRLHPTYVEKMGEACEKTLEPERAPLGWFASIWNWLFPAKGKEYRWIFEKYPEIQNQDICCYRDWYTMLKSGNVKLELPF